MNAELLEQYESEYGSSFCYVLRFLHENGGGILVTYANERSIFQAPSRYNPGPSTVSFPFRVARGATGARITVGFGSFTDYARLRYQYSAPRIVVTSRERISEKKNPKRIIRRTAKLQFTALSEILPYIKITTVRRKYFQYTKSFDRPEKARYKWRESIRIRSSLRKYFFKEYFFLLNRNMIQICGHTYNFQSEQR